MKDITCFIGSLGGGGAEHQMINLANFLIQKGYPVRIVTFIDTPDYYPLPKKVVRIRLGENKNNTRKFLSIFFFFLSIKTDCVISYTQRANLFCLIPLLFRRKIKVIAGERNMSRGKGTTREHALFNLFYHRANYIVPNSFTQASYIKEKKPSLASKVLPITNYTDISIFQPVPLPLGETFRIAIFARFQRQKNCLRFVDMLGQLKNQNIQKKFIIDWYGRHEFNTPVALDYYNQFTNKIKALGLESILHIKDPIKNVPMVMATYDAICLPSTMEGFSNSISEGISSGRPMIVGDISDNKIMVHDGENGILFNPFDVSDMLRAFVEFLSLSDEELIRMGKKSRDIAESLFNKNTFINAYIKLGNYDKATEEIESHLKEYKIKKSNQDISLLNYIDKLRQEKNQ